MLTCSNCGRVNPDDAAFCIVVRDRGDAGNARTEVRKTVTVGVLRPRRLDHARGATRARGPEPVLQRYFEEMRAAVERHGGLVEKFIGDAVVAVFGIPRLHEDDALRAVRAAVEMREAPLDVRR